MLFNLPGKVHQLPFGKDGCRRDTGSHPGTWWTRLQVNLVLLLYFPLELLLCGSVFFRTLTFTLSYSYIASPRSAQASMSKQFGFTWVPTPSSGAYTLARPKSSSSGQSGNRRRGPALPLVSDLFIEWAFLDMSNWKIKVWECCESCTAVYFSGDFQQVVYY